MSSTNAQPRPTPPLQNRESFWTKCGKCKMHFEFLKEYRNQNLSCPNCREPFLAIEVPQPPLKADTSSHSGIIPQQQQGVNNATSYTVAASNIQKASEIVKRQHKAEAKDAGNKQTKKRRVYIAKPAGYRGSRVQEGSSGGERTTVPGNEPINVESPLDLRDRVLEKVRMDIRKKLDEWKSAASSKSAPKEGKGNQTAVRAAEISAVSATNVELEAKGFNFLTMEVPDPDFHDFDMDRTEDSFSKKQVWALYDDDDGMPRFYALVHGIICKNPFQVRISWLKSKTNDELGPLDWIKSGFAKTCGEFRSGKQEIIEALNSFSHVVNWTKGARGVYHIFPKKGEIWALYKNWTSEWNMLTPDEIVHEYEMVEVVEDFTEHYGVAVAPLVKVAGFRSVFCPHKDGSQNLMIPKHELFRFSHQVPSYLLTNDEAQNAPRGCRELDPAALPKELLQVMQEDKVKEAVENAENAENAEYSDRPEGEGGINGGQPHAVADGAFAKNGNQ